MRLQEDNRVAPRAAAVDTGQQAGFTGTLRSERIASFSGAGCGWILPAGTNVVASTPAPVVHQ